MATCAIDNRYFCAPWRTASPTASSRVLRAGRDVAPLRPNIVHGLLDRITA
jgi:hypothetical protein